jgi:hypothetical protein
VVLGVPFIGSGRRCRGGEGRGGGQPGGDGGGGALSKW